LTSGVEMIQMNIQNSATEKICTRPLAIDFFDWQSTFHWTSYVLCIGYYITSKERVILVTRPSQQLLALMLSVTVQVPIPSYLEGRN